MQIEQLIREELKRILDKLEVELPIENIVIEHSKAKEHGDFATNLAMQLAKPLHKAPKMIAEMIVGEFCLSEVEKLEIAGPGFINFFLKSDSLTGLIHDIISQGDEYGHNDAGKGEKINVEYVSANPTGELHLGHARGAAVGDALTRILSCCGYDVTREYYVNDAGNQVNNLALSVRARYLQKLGEKVEVPDNGYHGQDVVAVAEKIFKEKGDALREDTEENRKYFKQMGIRLNLDKIIDDLDKFRVHFDVFTSEQWIRDEGMVEKAMADIKNKTYEHEGAVFLKTTDSGDDKDRVLVKSDGSYTYLVPDIAYHRYKYDRGFEHIIDILGADHHGYVARLKASMEALGKDPEKIEVLMVQMVRLFKDGHEHKMSKRTGNAVSMAELCEECGTDAVRFFFVTRSASSHLDFDLDLAKTMGSKNPVYYCQYAHARLAAILEAGNSYALDESGTLLTSESEQSLLKTLNDFKNAIIDAGLTREPYKVSIYIRKLATEINDFYTQCRVLDPANPKLTCQRLALIKAAKIVLKNALNLIGVSAPQTM